MEDVVYSVMNVSMMLKIVKNMVYNLIHSGLLPVLKMGGSKIRHSALLKFLEDYEGYYLTDLNNIHKL